MGRTPCCDKNNGLKKGPWTTEEDQKLIDYIQKHGYGNWRTLPKNAGLQRCGKSCRLRWTNYLRPDIKRGRFSFEEEETIIQLHSILGNKWSAIASRLPGRTDNEIKNYWNTHIRKRLLKMGIDPVTHNPRLDLLDLSSILCSSLQMNIQNLLGIQQVNPELLKLASSFISSQSQQRIQENYQPIQNQVTRFDQFQDTVQQLQDCVSNSLPSQQHFGEPNIKLENSYANINVDSYSSSFNDPNYQNGFGITDYHNIPQLSSYNNYYSSSDDDQNLMYQYQTSTSTYGNHHNQYLSTPSSSPTPLNSNSTHVTEDERESYVSSNRLQFEISDILDANEFM